MEVNRGDGSLGTFLGVQAGLAMRAINLLGSEEQREHWLPSMARVEQTGAFALTEPDHGSDSVALETRARPDGDDYVIDGAKRWIGNGSVADVVVVWARDEADGEVKGFLVEKGTPGYEATPIAGKGAVRAIWQADIARRRRVPGRTSSPARTASRTPARCSSRRAAFAPGARSAAMAAYDTALTYALRREQFGKPLASFQIVQDRLVKMLAEVTAMQLYCMQLARLESAGRMSDTIAGLAKLNNTRKALGDLRGARPARRQRILLENHVMRHGRHRGDPHLRGDRDDARP